jgi:hypothetical protein
MTRAQTMPQASGIEAFSFGDPVAVLDRRELLTTRRLAHGGLV